MVSCCLRTLNIDVVEVQVLVTKFALVHIHIQARETLQMFHNARAPIAMPYQLKERFSCTSLSQQSWPSMV